jgi:hypothetical protein
VRASGVIFAALDCDLDAIEEWNRWYDLEHTPMNVSLAGVMLSRRMRFPAEKKVVREGDVFAGTDAFGCDALGLRPHDVPFVGHTGVIVVQRRGEDGRAERIAQFDGVTGTWSMESRSRPDFFLDMIFVEEDVGARAVAIRDAVPHAGADVLFDAPFELINPLAYPWADAMRASDLPPTVD